MIEKMLDALAELQFQLDMVNLTYNQARESLIPADIREQIDELEAERVTTLEPVNRRISELTAAVKAAVVEHGASVKGAHLQAVYSQGRVSWDSRTLDGYAIAHPEILTAKKVGEPSVSIRGSK